MAFESIFLEEDIHIEKIYTIHYFEYMNTFQFPGERHDFWEFQCVDSGEVEICTDDGPHLLTRGQVIFHRPNEFHTLKAAGKSGPSVVVVSFECLSPAMLFFEKRILTLTERERSLLGQLIAEARRCILTPLDDPYTERMEKQSDAVFGSLQLIRLYLEEILLLMIRRNIAPQPKFFTPPLGADIRHPILYDKIIFYLEDHIREYVTVEDICRDNLIGRSLLQKIFREQHGCGVIEFFSRMKIEFARQLIRENQMNFTQISDFLGYSSIHYFSRQFKKLSGMTPTEYSSSIRAKMERTEAH